MWTQGQTKQDDWPEEAWKDCPHTSDLNDLQTMHGSLPLLLFLSLSLSLSTAPPPRQPACICAFSPPVFSLFSLKISTYLSHYPQSLCQILSLKGHISRDLHQVVWVQLSHLTATWEQIHGITLSLKPGGGGGGRKKKKKRKKNLKFQ